MQIRRQDKDAGRSRARRIDSPGAKAASFATGYDVQVVYTEPEFQRRTPGAPAEYSFVYSSIAARSPEDAIRVVLRDFRETARRSWVGWRRRVERVIVLRGPSHRLL